MLKRAAMGRRARRQLPRTGPQKPTFTEGESCTPELASHVERSQSAIRDCCSDGAGAGVGGEEETRRTIRVGRRRRCIGTGGGGEAGASVKDHEEGLASL